MEINNKRPKLMFEKYRWNITNFSKLNPGKRCSDKFIIDDYTWKIVITLSGGIGDCLQIYLEADKDCGNLPEGWKKTANFNLALINQVDDTITLREGFEFEFSADHDSYGFDFLTLAGLKNHNGFVMNDSCIIEAGIFVTKYVDEDKEYESLCKIDDSPVNDNTNPLFRQMFRSSFENIERKFVPLLEKACLEYPSLVVSLEKRSCKFSEWALTALGRFLHFLNTKYRIYMDDKTYKHLLILWDEVKTFGFELPWLELCVEAVSEAKRNKDDFLKARKNVSALKDETKLLKAILIEKETQLEMATKDFMKAQEIFFESTSGLNYVWKICEFEMFLFLHGP